MKTLMDYVNAPYHIGMKLSVSAIVVLATTQGFAADWTIIKSKIENGSINIPYHVYTGNVKSSVLTPTTFQQQKIVNLAGKISDDNNQNNTEINGFSLNIEKTPLDNKMLILAAGSYSGNVTQNQLNLTDITDGYDLDVRGGHSYNGITKGNNVMIQHSAIDQVYGGTSRIGVADDNNVTISDKSEIRVVHGGRTWFSKQGAKNNKVDISGSIASWVYGGESQGGEVSDNKVILRNTGNESSLTRAVIGGKSANSTKADVHHNEVQIIGSDVEESQERDSGVYGGLAAYGNADYNKVSIESTKHHQSIISADVFGANNEGRNTYGGPVSTANHNQVNIMGAVIQGNIYGAKSAGSDTSGNTINIQGDLTHQANIQSVYGGYTFSGSASNNRLSVTQAQLAGDIYGGYINDGYEKQASQNHITLSNVNVTGNVYGGYNSGTDSSVINNVIDLKENVNIKGVVAGGLAESSAYGGNGFFGGLSGFSGLSGLSNLGSFGSNAPINADVTSGNILNLYAANIKAKNIKNFSVYNFILPSNITANSNILTTTGNDDTDLTHSKVNVIFPAAINLNVGDGINLVETKQGKLLLDSKMQTQITSPGLIRDYQFELEQGDNHILRAVLKSKNTNAYGNNALNVARLSTEITERLWDSMDDSVGAFTQTDLPTTLMPFANISSFKTRYGEHSTKMNGTVFFAGVVVKRNTQTYGGFIENSYADYHSKQGKVAFDGKIRVYGAGVFGHINLPYHFYTKGILKAGRIETRNHNSSVFNYNLYMPYYNAGFSLGQRLPLGSFIWDNSLAYVYSYVSHDQIRVNHQDMVIQHSHANKLKAQTQIIYHTSIFQPFAKLKFDYKLNSTTGVVAYPDNDSISSGYKGGNIGGEIGFRYFPIENVQLNMNLGYMNGKWEETTGKMEFMYRF